MKHDIFSIPIFIDKVDLSKINFENDSKDNYVPTFGSQLKTNKDSGPKFTEKTYQYLTQVMSNNFSQLGHFKNASIYCVWRNKYSKDDYQEVHIHPNSKWSFVIYENVQISKTVFLNPAWKLIENMYMPHEAEFIFKNRFIPNLSSGDLIIFPSFLEHFVLSGNEGTTISGNIFLDF